jgi:hypothetical protein
LLAKGIAPFDRFLGGIATVGAAFLIVAAVKDTEEARR